jgi:hypothetical protein
VNFTGKHLDFNRFVVMKRRISHLASVYAHKAADGRCCLRVATGSLGMSRILNCANDCFDNAECRVLESVALEVCERWSA